MKKNKSSFTISFLSLVLIVLCNFAGVGMAQDLLYDVEFRGADIRSAIRLMATMRKKNVVVPDTLKGTVTASFDQINLSDAMDAILDSHSLVAVTKGNTIRILDLADAAKEGFDLVTLTVPIKYARSAEVITQVQTLLSARGSVISDVRTNSLTVRDTRESMRNIKAFIASVDLKDRQVLLEAKVVEANKDFFRGLGIAWNLTKTAGNNSYTVGTDGDLTIVKGKLSGTTSSTTTDTSGTGEKKNLGIGSVGAIIGAANLNIDAKIQAAEKTGEAHILSKPSIITLNNQKATIHSGEKFFLQSSGSISIGTTGSSDVGGTSAIESGITLDVTPQITMDNYIKLLIAVTESALDFSREVEGVPVIIENTANTTLYVKDGETTVIGGLYKVVETKTESGVPLLSKIPLLGAFFGATGVAKSKNELLIFIRPTVVQSNMQRLPAWSKKEERETDIALEEEEEEEKEPEEQ